jgi:hypothetical protein
VGRGQPSAGQNNSNAMPQNSNDKQQPANQNAGAGQQRRSERISLLLPCRARTVRSSRLPDRTAETIREASLPTHKPQQSSPNSSNK